MYSPTSLYDTIVIGGGIVGAATADALNRKGKRVLLIEQFEPGHTRGSSHGDGRIIRFAYPEAIYVEMAILAYRAWENLEARAGEPFVKTTGGWDCGPADSPQLADLEANFQRYDIFYERLSASESNQRFPHFHLDSGSEAVFQPDAGVVYATPAVLALWRLFEENGGHTITGERVEVIEAHGEQVEVRGVFSTTWHARSLVITAGAWSRQLLAQLDLHLPLQVTQEQVAYFAPPVSPDHRAGAMPVFIDYHTVHPFYGLPQIEVPGVKVGWHHTGRPIDPDNPEPLSQQNLDAVKRFVRERLPHLQTEPFERLTCLYTNTPDYHFILDRHPSLPNVVIGTGFSGHGFKFGPVVGEILAGLASNETPPLPLDSFAVNRFQDTESLVRRTGA